MQTSVRRYSEFKCATKQKSCFFFFILRLMGYLDAIGEKEMELMFIWITEGSMLMHQWYLFIILKFIVQDDSIRLVRLGPGEGDAVHRAADLVHYRHSGRSCEETGRRQCVKDEANNSTAPSQSRTERFIASLIPQPNAGFHKGVRRNAIKCM